MISECWIVLPIAGWESTKKQLNRKFGIEDENDNYLWKTIKIFRTVTSDNGLFKAIDIKNIQGVSGMKTAPEIAMRGKIPTPEEIEDYFTDIIGVFNKPLKTSEQLVNIGNWSALNED